MTRVEFLDILRRRLSGLPPAEIDDLIADYGAHFAEGAAAGRDEAEIARALGDPVRLARELRAEAGFRRWEAARTPANFFSVLFGFLVLIAVDFVFLLPMLGALVLFAFIAGIVLIGLCIAGFALMVKTVGWGFGLFSPHFLARTFAAIGLLGVGIGGGALLILMVDYVVRLLGRFARLHYALLDSADRGGAHV